MKIVEMEAGSAYTKRLPRGCVLCRPGSKLVLLATGRCSTGCFYCPLSKKKRGRDVVYADELKVNENADILLEASLIKAKGTGITGGDPLCELDRVLRFIRLLKKELGPQHHVHLYTSSIDRKAYLRLQRAGLDELRIHPELKHWKRMERTGLEEAVHGLRMKIGIEVPSIPGEEGATEALIRYVERIGLDFVNLNELEFSETNCKRLEGRGIEAKDDISAAAKGSEELASKMLRLGVRIPIHYCSSAFKDSVQLKNRIMRRAKSVAREGDVITEEGTLLKGVVEGRSASKAKKLFAENYDVPERLMHWDAEKRRLEVAPWVLQEISSQLPFDSYIVEEYPTADRLEVERERLKGGKKGMQG